MANIAEAPTPWDPNHKMKRFAWKVLVLCTAAAGAAWAQQPAAFRARPPELQGVTEWVNSKPLTLAGLKGRVVVLHFWTFG